MICFRLNVIRQICVSDTGVAKGGSVVRDIHSDELKNCAFHRFGMTGGFVTATLNCGHCGKTCQEVSLPMYSEDVAVAMLLQKVYHQGWRSDGNQLLCRPCSEVGQQLSA